MPRIVKSNLAQHLHRTISRRKEVERLMIKKSELDRFRKTLTTIQAELSDGHYKREALAIETSADELDRIQHAQERDFAVGVLSRGSVRLREVRAALERIERGSFGICVNCVEDIGAKRLAAVPWAALCIVCQEAADRMASNDVEQLLLNAA
jgi:DnaK suppressor protein